MSSDINTGRHTPMRFCVGCNQVSSRAQMVRLVVDQGEVILDLTGTEAGRGAWIHPSADCVKKAKRRKVFFRAFKCSNLNVPSEVFEQILKAFSGSQSADRCIADESGLEADGHPMSTQR